MWIILYKTKNEITSSNAHFNGTFRIIGNKLAYTTSATLGGGSSGDKSRSVTCENKIVQFISKYDNSGSLDNQNYSRGFNYTCNKDTEVYTYIAYK